MNIPRYYLRYVHVPLDTREFDMCLKLMLSLEQLDGQQHSVADVVRLIVRDWLRDGKADKLRE